MTTLTKYIIHPYYTGRDKGPVCKNGSNELLTFPNEGSAWRYIFTVLQPNDERACTNYHVRTLADYERSAEDFRVQAIRKMSWSARFLVSEGVLDNTQATMALMSFCPQPGPMRDALLDEMGKGY